METDHDSRIEGLKDSSSSLNQANQGESHATWAIGCDKCSAGLRGKLAVPAAAYRLWEVRYMQARAGLVWFCGCRAGLLYRQYLHKIEERLQVEDKSVEYLAELRKHVTGEDKP